MLVSSANEYVQCDGDGRTEDRCQEVEDNESVETGSFEVFNPDTEKVIEKARGNSFEIHGTVSLVEQ